ncbi:hypothetical protein MPSEU_000164700 [Mayamaea pseudoterrestris]|nr:hypothetical protein MPSEU_000164700 [Mayamaea pseudoterrestris]
MALSMAQVLVIIALSLSFVLHGHAWTTSRSISGASSLLNLKAMNKNRRITQPPLYAIASLSLESLQDDHEQMGSDLGGSVQRWLDAEWMIQECHVRIGQSCAETYVQCRNENEDDLMSIMMQVAQNLEGNWRKSYDDAFVNAWDVSNYVSDYLTAKVGIEGCECSAKIY